MCGCVYGEEEGKVWGVAAGGIGVWRCDGRGGGVMARLNLDCPLMIVSNNLYSTSA